MGNAKKEIDMFDNLTTTTCGNIAEVVCPIVDEFYNNIREILNSINMFDWDNRDLVIMEDVAQKVKKIHELSNCMKYRNDFRKELLNTGAIIKDEK